MIYGYVRVSTASQNTDRQLKGVKVDRMFEDKKSGKNTDREAFKELDRILQAGDVVKVHSVDRLARSISDLDITVKAWVKRGITVEFIKEHMIFAPDTDNAMQKMMFQMLGVFAEFEREMIVSRIKEGLAVAKENGVKLGKRINPNTDREAIRSDLEAGLTVRAVATKHGVSVGTVQNIKKEA